MPERREWHLAVRILVAVVGLLVACAAGLVAAVVGGLAACEGSSAYANDGVSESWVCQEMARPLLHGLEWAFFVTAFLAPLVGTGVTVRASRAIWLVVGLAVGAIALMLQFLVNHGQVGVLS